MAEDGMAVSFRNLGEANKPREEISKLLKGMSVDEINRIISDARKRMRELEMSGRESGLDYINLGIWIEEANRILEERKVGFERKILK